MNVNPNLTRYEYENAARHQRELRNAVTSAEIQAIVHDLDAEDRERDLDAEDRERDLDDDIGIDYDDIDIDADHDTETWIHERGSWIRTSWTPVTSPSADDSDDTKVTRFQEQAERNLHRDIRNAGEGGWPSPWYTGSPEALAESKRRAYTEWRNARDNWTVTGKEDHRLALLAAVDFDCPPGAGDVAVPVTAPAAVPKTKQKRFVPLTVAFVACLCSMLLGCLLAVGLIDLVTLLTLR